jgi:hypothetical protein
MSQAEVQQHGVMPIQQQSPGAPVASVANPLIVQGPQNLVSFPQIALPLSLPLQGQVVGAMLPSGAPMVFDQSGALLQHQMQLQQQTEGSQP